MPPQYVLESAIGSISADPGVDMLDLRSEPGGFSLVDLAFSFPFYGVAYSQLFVSATAGYVTFEEPRSSHGFGVVVPRSAVVVCYGVFDLDSDKAAVKMAQSDSEHIIRWHAPLFHSNRASDVSLVLWKNGSLRIRWDQVSLEGGSLGNGLAKWLMQPGTQSLQISNQSTADEPGGATILGLPNSSHTLPVDATKFFPGGMQMQYFYPNSSVGLDLNHVDLSNGTWGEVMGAQNHGTI